MFRASQHPSSGVLKTVTATSGIGHTVKYKLKINPLNAKLNPILHLVALLGAHPILHVSMIRVN